MDSFSLPDVPTWLWVAGGAACLAVFATVFGVAMFLLFRKQQAPPNEAHRMALDWEHPIRRWSRGCYSIVTRDYDYAYRPKWTKEVVASSWKFRTRPELEATLEKLEAGYEAWDLVRFIVVARMGVGMGLWDEDTSWMRITPVVQRLQPRYKSWDELGSAYVEGRREWLDLALDGSEDDDSMREVLETIAVLRAKLWPAIPYNLALISRITGPTVPQESGR